MPYLWIGLLIAVFALVLVLKGALSSQRESSPKTKKRKRKKVKKDFSPQEQLFFQEILEKRQEFKIYSLSKYAALTTRELTETQKEVLYTELKRFPLPSGAALKLSELLKDPYVNSREVAAIAATDPVLSARLLAIVNSAYFRPRSGKKVTSIHQAILLLGFNQVRNLLFQTLLEHAITKHSPLPKEEIQRIWIHSATVSVTAGFLAKEKGLSSGLALTAGLMHDIGKFFLPFFEVGDEGSYLLQEEELPPLIAEEQKYGFNHTVIGAVLCHLWRLPEEISQAVAFHHLADPERLQRLSPHLQQVILLVAVADYLCHYLGLAEEEKYLYALPSKMLKDFGYPDPIETLLTPKLKKEIEKMAALLQSFYE